VKKLILLTFAFCAFLLGYGVIAKAFPAGGLWGRAEYRGYFGGGYDDFGTYVWPAIYSGMAIPSTTDTAAELISLVHAKLGGTAQERTGAGFIIQTMISPQSAPNYSFPGPAQIAEWDSRVNAAAAQGRISWNFNFSHSYNSYWQSTGPGLNYNDDAFYDDANTSLAIVFRNASGQIVYGIRRQCANPIGTGLFGPIPDNPNFNMDGYTDIRNGPTNPSPGESFEFRHFLYNPATGSGDTAPTTINWTARNMITNAVVGSGNAGTFAPGVNRLVFIYPITVPAGTPAGTQYCQRLEWNPDTQAGGTMPGGTVCATVVGDFDLNPSINVTVNGGAVAGNIAEQGDSITFTYAVNNTDTGTSNNTACTIYGFTRNGYYTIPSPHDSTSDPGFVQPAHGCPRNFPANTNTTLVSETVPASTANRSICRSLFVNPATPGGGPASAEVCAYVANKPYTRVWGGDVSAGNGLADSSGACTNNANAAVVGWNKRAAGSYAGAGSQFAVYAMNAITDFASALFDPGGAVAPTGLSFTNTATSTGTGLFGGNLGSVPCIPNYYSTLPASAVALPASPNVGTLASGTYTASGNITLAGGAVPANKRITIYVNGNVYISSNITYSGTWGVGSIPQFRLIVQGNIYIDNDITQVDGTYIAQRSGANTGSIHTCIAVAPFTPLPLDGALNARCNRKLTVNGSLVADNIRLIRTIGTLSQSNNAEASTMPHIAEVFNYSPALWIPQPADSGPTSDYDAIISLPPIL
jgi:hypothetical protein